MDRIGGRAVFPIDDYVESLVYCLRRSLKHLIREWPVSRRLTAVCGGKAARTQLVENNHLLPQWY